MKKKIIYVLLAIIVAVAGYVLFMESHFSTTAMVESNLSTEQLLKEEPRIAFTEDDVAMINALLESKDIADAFLIADKSEANFYAFPQQKAAELVKDWVPDGFEVSDLTVEKNDEVFVSFFKNDKHHIYYAFTANLEKQTKVIVTFGRDLLGDVTIKKSYENFNGEITKYKAKHLWFE